MRELELQNVYNKCLLDNDDYEIYKEIKCYSSHDGHVNFWNKSTKQIHRIIMNVTDKNLFVDHIDGNPFNNQKYNLRICEKFGNAKNLKISSRNTSGYKGVDFYKSTHKWQARILVNNKCIHLGYFLTPEEAAQAYDEASKKYHGEFSSPNSEIKERKPIEILWKPTKFEDPNLKPGMVPLGHGKYAYVDLDDYERVMLKTWRLNNKTGYVMSSVGQSNMYLHRFIMNPDKDKTVDHINRDKTNNRKENLRICTMKENSSNRKKTIKNKYQGVQFKNKKWVATVGGKYIGSFETEQEAAIAYNESAVNKFGEFAYINIIK